MLKILYLDHSALMQSIGLTAQNVILLMLVRQDDICLHERVSIFIQIKSPKFLNTLRALINAKLLAMIVVSVFWTRQALTINLKVRKRCIFCGKGLS